MAPSRFPKGLTNVSPQSPLYQFPAPDPSRLTTFFNDFTNTMDFPLAASALAAASTATWTVTVTEGGGGDATSVVADINGGGIKLTTDAADNDLIFAQHANACFTLSAGKKGWFKIKFKITDASANAASINECEWYAGLMVRDTDPLSSTAGDGVTDGVFFMSEDGSQDVYLHCQKNATTGQLSTKLTNTLTVNTLTEWAWYWDGVEFIEVFVDGNKVTTIDLTATASTYLPDTVMNVSFGIKNGEAVAKVMTLDYILAALEK